MVCLATVFFGLGLSFFQKPATAELRPEATAAFNQHTSQREAEIRERIRGGGLLWVDLNPERVRRVRAGEVLVEPRSEKGSVEVKGGMIHDWIGAAFVPNATLKQTLERVKNYDNHKNVYKPEVADSRILSRTNENQMKIHLRLVKKKVITVVLSTEHDVKFFPLDASRVHSRSVSTRIAEVDDAGTANERELPVGQDHGFLWRLNSYWRFQERDGGVYIECEAISLTRGVPTGFGWLINPIVRDLPRESLTNTIEATRQYVD